MPTNNPKVSGYIPQDLYDVFMQFCDSNEVSMSKGVILVFEGYFGISQDKLPDRVSQEKLDSLIEQIESLKNRVNESSMQSENSVENKIQELTNQLNILNAKVEALFHKETLRDKKSPPSNAWQV